MGFIKVGVVAPAFTLLDQRGNGVSLADYAGKKCGYLLLSQSNDSRLYCSSLWYS